MVQIWHVFTNRSWMRIVEVNKSSESEVKWKWLRSWRLSDGFTVQRDSPSNYFQIFCQSYSGKGLNANLLCSVTIYSSHIKRLFCPQLPFFENNTFSTPSKMHPSLFQSSLLKIEQAINMRPISARRSATFLLFTLFITHQSSPRF